MAVTGAHDPGMWYEVEITEVVTGRAHLFRVREGETLVPAGLRPGAYSVRSRAVTTHLSGDWTPPEPMRAGETYTMEVPGAPSSEAKAVLEAMPPPPDAPLPDFAPLRRRIGR